MGARDSSPSAGAENTGHAAEPSTPSSKHARTRSARAFQDNTAASHSVPARTGGDKGARAARAPRSRKPETGTAPSAPSKKPAKPSSAERPANATEQAGAPSKPAGHEPKAQEDRWNLVPQNDLDFEDRHVIRATDPKSAQYYAALRKDQRKDAWQRLLMWLVALFMATGAYLAGVWLLMSQFPELTPNEVVKIVSVPFATAGLGAGTAWTGRTIHQAYVRRRDSKAL